MVIISNSLWLKKRTNDFTFLVKSCGNDQEIIEWFSALSKGMLLYLLLNPIILQTLTNEDYDKIRYGLSCVKYLL